MDKTEKTGIVFMGTSGFSRTILESLQSNESFQIKGVYTQPDRKVGRGLKMSCNPVKEFCLENSLPCFQPANFKDSYTILQLESLNADFLVVASYGIILPQRVLDAARYAPVNVHASLLPAYRGAAPIQRAIQENYGPDAKTGISIMKMVKEMDAGPVYAKEIVPVAGLDHPALSERLAGVGALLLNNVLQQIVEKGMQPIEQEHEKATYAPKLRKEENKIDWRMSAAQVDAQIRAFVQWPGSGTVLRMADAKDIPVTICAGYIGGDVSNARPGEVFRENKLLKIACSDKFFIITKLRPANGREMDSGAFANGHGAPKSGLCGAAI